jgi:hypothetical protein
MGAFGRRAEGRAEPSHSSYQWLGKGAVPPLVAGVSPVVDCHFWNCWTELMNPTPALAGVLKARFEAPVILVP